MDWKSQVLSESRWIKEGIPGASSGYGRRTMSSHCHRAPCFAHRENRSHRCPNISQENKPRLIIYCPNGTIWIQNRTDNPLFTCTVCLEMIFFPFYRTSIYAFQIVVDWIMYIHRCRFPCARSVNHIDRTPRTIGKHSSAMYTNVHSLKKTTQIPNYATYTTLF